MEPLSRRDARIDELALVIRRLMPSRPSLTSLRSALKSSRRRKLAQLLGGRGGIEGFMPFI